MSRRWQPKVIEFEKIDSARFWSKVDKGQSGCWPWLSTRTRSGYGCFSYGGRLVSAHRVSFVLHHGSLKAELDVIHTCDNPGCVNPAHLVSGSHKQNMLDRARKLRGAKKLTPDDVREIRKSEQSFRAIGREFGVCHDMVSRIKRGVNWGHVV